MSNKRSIGIALIGIAVLAVIAVTMHTPIEEKKTAVSSSDIKPAVIFDMGGKFDKSFKRESRTKTSAETMADKELQKSCDCELGFSIKTFRIDAIASTFRSIPCSRICC